MTIKSEWIAEGINLIQKNPKISAVVPAYVEQDHHPYRAKFIDNNGFLKPYFDFSDKFISSNRQDLLANYFLSHNFWILNISMSIEANDGYKPWVFMGKNVQPIIVEDCFDVLSLNDIKRSTNWIKENIDAHEIY